MCVIIIIGVYVCVSITSPLLHSRLQVIDMCARFLWTGTNLPEKRMRNVMYDRVHSKMHTSSILLFCALDNCVLLTEAAADGRIAYLLPVCKAPASLKLSVKVCVHV